MRIGRLALLATCCWLATLASAPGDGGGQHQNAVIDLWAAGVPAFGVFVPNENPGRRGRGAARGTTARPRYTAEGGERLALNPLYDYVFLNLEGRYEAAAVEAIATGLRSPRAVGHTALIVRIPPIEREGPDVARARIREVFDLGADGVTIPHVRDIEEARLAVSFFADFDVWSPSNPRGEKLAMLMIEDPGALAQARAFADLGGYSLLACGIGSLRGALGGDREAAEAGTQAVLAESTRAGLPNMLTANARDVEQRINEGFLALLMQGAGADEAIEIGRRAARRVP
jgi:2-keto-3-deoxy-L-rhamnonate aldolase RhmA